MAGGVQPRRIYVAFEGGGAKGISHIGALKAINELEAKGIVEVKGYAGTSAGAMVAALAAAGYTADELFDDRPGRNSDILTLLSAQIKTLPPSEQVAFGDISSPTGLFGSGGWSIIQRFFGRSAKMLKRLRSVLPQWSVWLSVALVLTLLVAVGWGIVIGPANQHAPAVWSFAVGMAVLLIVVLLGALISIFWILGGLANVGNVRRVYEFAVAQKLKGRIKSGPPLFDHLSRAANAAAIARGAASRPLLKIIGTNISRGELKLFSPETTPFVPIADAVAASMCIPTIFEAHTVGGDRYFDGGLVSNLPVWAFDEERAMDQDALTIAIELGDTDPQAARPSSDKLKYDWVAPTLRTAIFGANALNVRAAGRLHTIRLTNSLDMLDFDKTREEYRQAVIEAADAARRQIQVDILGIPRLLDELCLELRDLIALGWTEAMGGRLPGGTIRVAIAVLEGGFTETYRVSHTAGFSCCEEGLLLPVWLTFVSELVVLMDTDEEGRDPNTRRVLLAGDQFNTRAFSRLGFGDEAPAAPAPENRLRAACAWPDRKWLYCRAFDADGDLPKRRLEDGFPKYIVMVDGDHPISDPEVGGLILGYVDQIVVTKFVERIKKTRDMQASKMAQRKSRS